jgi:YbbR domain-containing protein
VTPYYDQEQYILTGLPDSVSVSLTGPENLITKTTLANDYELFVDLEGKEPGTYTLPVQTRGFPEELQVNTDPAQVRVTLHEKVTKTFSVDIDVENEDEMKEGYEPGDPIANPNQVRVTAAKETIEQIAAVKGAVDMKGADDTVEDTVPLKIYGEDSGKELNLEMSPSVVDVKVPVAGPSKTVPINISNKTSIPDDLSIASIEKDPNEVTLFGPNDVLEDIEFVEGW